MTHRADIFYGCFLVFDGVDGLDFAGPLEIFLDVHYGIDYTSPDPAFNLTIIAPFDLISTSAAVKITPDASIASVRSKLGESDILVVPGGQLPIVFVLVESNSEVLQIRLRSSAPEAVPLTVYTAWTTSSQPSSTSSNAHELPRSPNATKFSWQRMPREGNETPVSWQVTPSAQGPKAQHQRWKNYGEWFYDN
ncbi:unnamed protein product [Penicillium discolor]